MRRVTFYEIAIALLVGAWIVTRSRPAEATRQDNEREQDMQPEPTPQHGLHEARQALQASEAARLQERLRSVADREEFLAMLGHELRNPLNAVSTAVEVMRRPNVSEKVADSALNVVERQVQRLTSMLNDMLDATGVLSGEMKLMRQPIDLAALVARVAARFELDEPSAAGRLVVEGAEPLWVNADAARIEQVVTQLLTNALKYSADHALVTVLLHMEGGQARVRVCDQGERIPDDLLPRIFEVFKQGERALDRRAGGLGLGLAVARRLVEMHGGRLEPTSGDHGNCFEIRLPLGEPAMPRSAVRQGSCRVLVIEDNEDAKRSLCDVLVLDGHAVQSAGDGAAGLELLVRDRPDVVIVDIGLPLIDGFEVALRARASGYGGRMIAVSGYGQPHDARQALHSGFDEHMAKPLDGDKLRRLLWPA